MNLERKYKWTLAGFIIMVILNLGILTTLWMNGPSSQSFQMDRGAAGFGKGSMHAQFQEQLSLSEIQSDSMNTLRKAHFREMRQLRRELDQKRNAYLEFVLGNKGNNSDIRDSLLADLTSQFTEMESKMYQHMQQMRDVLSPDQETAFKKMMINALSRGQNKEHRGPGHR